MDVTSRNFPDFLEDFKKSLPLARLCSFDFELTGIATAQQDLWWDLPFERFAKMQFAANKYNIIQVGLSLFIPQKSPKIEDFLKDFYEVRTYNIYVFPRVNSEYSPQINCDSSAMEFNVKHGMDWQKWITEGISYLPQKKCKKLLEKILKEKEEYVNDEHVLFSETEKGLMEVNISKLEQWINDEAAESFMLHENNPQKRAHYYQYIEKNHQQLTAETVRNGPDCYIKVMKLSEAQKKALQEERRRVRLDKFEAEKGFTVVFELLAKSKIPFVGHNCFFDLLFWMRHFHNNLTSYQKFKRSLHKYFPNIFDTKYIGNNCPLKKEFEKGSSLSDYHKSMLFGKLKVSGLEFILPPGFEGYRFDIIDGDGKLIESEEKKAIEFPAQKVRYHEAGYDAFLTGVAFLHFEKVLNLKNFEKSFVNRLNLMSSYFVLRLDGRDVVKESSLVFVVLDHSKKEYKKAFREVEFAFKSVEENTWVKQSYYDYEHPIFASFREGQEPIDQEPSRELTSFFMIHNKKRELFFSVLFSLKTQGYTVMSFARYVEGKVKGAASPKHKKEEDFDI